MKRNALTVFALSFAILIANRHCYATNTKPTPKIVEPNDPHYVKLGDSVSFDAEGSGTETPPTGSYDEDDGPPNGGGRGIDKYYWHFGDELPSEPWYNANGATLSHTYESADKYYVSVKVTDGDDPCKADTLGCKVYVVEVEIDEPDDFPVYIGLDAGLTLEASVSPATASGGTFSWSQVSGPAGAGTFESGDVATTSFSADTVGTYTVQIEYSIGGITCSALSGTIEVCDAKMVFKTGDPEVGANAIVRGESGTFEVTDGVGDEITGATYANWEFNGDVDASNPNHTVRTWSGIIVQGGTASCEVDLPGDPDPITCTVSNEITIDPRSGWSLTPTFADDNEPNWGENDYPGDGVQFGAHRDRESDENWIIGPRNASNEFKDAYDCNEVSSGPNKGVWYIGSSTVQIDNESVINMFIKPGATDYPDPPNEGWYEHNAAEGVDNIGGLPDGIRNHEGYGTDGNGKGHQALIEDEEDDPGNDAVEAIEDNIAESNTALETLTEGEIGAIELTLKIATMESKISAGDNWGPTRLYIYLFTGSGWDLSAPYGK